MIFGANPLLLKNNQAGGIPQDYVAYYKMETTTFTDETGNYTGTRAGPTVVTGIDGNGYSFDAANDYATSGAGAAFTGDYLCRMFLNFTTTASGVVSAQIFGGIVFNYRGAFVSSGAIRCITRNNDSSGVQIISASTWNDGNWHSAIFGQEGLDIFLIIDDVAETENTASSVPTFDSNIDLGRRRDGAAFYGGLMDEVVYYDRGLSTFTSAEITALATEFI